MKKQPLEWLHFFERVSYFHRQMLVIPLWKKYPNHKEDIGDSLAIFLKGYAFERSGSSPNYADAAVDALLKCKEQNNGMNARTIWEEFKKLHGSEGLNEKNNPLFYQNSNGGKDSLIEVVTSKNIKSFTTYFRDKISGDKNIWDAFGLLDSIRGVGVKIASLYLRDLVDIMGTKLDDILNIQNRKLLQPVDVWVERTVKILSENYNMDKEQVAEWIVNKSAENKINPERVNMGIWFFCSQIVKSEYKLKNVIDNAQDLEGLLKDFKSGIINASQNCCI